MVGQPHAPARREAGGGATLGAVKAAATSSSTASGASWLPSSWQDTHRRASAQLGANAACWPSNAETRPLWAGSSSMREGDATVEGCFAAAACMAASLQGRRVGCCSHAEGEQQGLESCGIRLPSSQERDTKAVLPMSTSKLKISLHPSRA